MAAVPDQSASAGTPTRQTRRALGAGLTRLQKRALKALGYVVLVYLLYRLLPALKQALHSLEHVRWEWIVGAVALELLSEFGYVQSWRAIVDQDGLLAADGRGTRTATRAAWAQLGGGMLVPGGSLASIGIGAWILRHFGMPARTIAERQFNLGFLNTAVDALALVLFGVGLGAGIFGGESNPLLTWLPAGVAAAGVAIAAVLGRRGTKRARSLETGHPKLAAATGSLAEAVDATGRILFHRGSRRSVLGSLAYLGFDALVLWTAFLAIHANPVPGFAAVVMAYIIGAWRLDPAASRNWGGRRDRRHAHPLRRRAQRCDRGGAPVRGRRSNRPAPRRQSRVLLAAARFRADEDPARRRPRRGRGCGLSAPKQSGSLR